MKEPITALRLSKRHRGFLEHISDETGASMTAVVEFLLDGAITRPQRWPSKRGRRPPLRGQKWRVVRTPGKGRYGIDPDPVG